MSGLPPTWYPELLKALVEGGYRAGTWQPGGASLSVLDYEGWIDGTGTAKARPEPVERPPYDRLVPLLGLVLVADPSPDLAAMLVSLTLGCTLCEIAGKGPDATLESVPRVLGDTAFADRVDRYAGDRYAGDWQAVIAYLRHHPEEYAS